MTSSSCRYGCTRGRPRVTITPDGMNTIRSAALWLSLVLLTTGMFMVSAPTALIAMLLGDRRRWLAHYWCHWWAMTAIRINPAWHITVDQTRIPRDRHFVLAVNHQSLADILITLQLDHHFKFISKSSVFHVPFLGWHMRVAGYIPLARGRRRSIVECMAQARDWLDRGVSVLFYPEGTRSRDQSIGTFKLGAFRIAVESGVDVLPVLILGSANFLPKASFHFTRTANYTWIVACDPIPVAGLTLDDVPALAERARRAILEMREKIEGKIPASGSETAA